MIWFLLLCKVILAVWFLTKDFKYSGIFWLSHTTFDATNKLYLSHNLGIFTFIVIPHLLISFLAEISNLKHLRWLNLVSVASLFAYHTIYGIRFQDLLSYFLLYSVIVLIVAKRSISWKIKESFPLFMTLLFQILGTLFYHASNNYFVVNVVNSIHYMGLFVFLYLLKLTKNGPMLTDPEPRNSYEANLMKKAA